MEAVLIVQVEQVGLCLFPRKSYCGRLFRESVGVVRRIVRGGARGTEVSLFNSPVLSRAGLTLGTQD